MVGPGEWSGAGRINGASGRSGGVNGEGGGSGAKRHSLQAVEL